MTYNLSADSREKLGTSESRRIRNQGKIPAVIYQKGENLNITIPTKEFEIEYFKGSVESKFAKLSLNGKAINVIASNIELDPVTDRPIHVDFIDCDSASTIKAKLKIKLLNSDKSVGLKKGGFLNFVARKVEVTCKSINNIPEAIEIDITKLEIGQKITAKDLVMPENVTLTNKSNFLVLSMIGRAGPKEAEATEQAATSGEAAKK